jgi:3-oxoacyl-(acyl-carrier-protein) synthase
MNNALDMAGLKPSDIDYVCAHGTGTVMNDEIEIKAIQNIFGSNDKLKVSSLKSFIGHTLGASAVLELAISLMALKENKIYQVSNLGTVIDEKLVPCQTITHHVKYFFNNAFGFGGNNVAMLVKML